MEIDKEINHYLNVWHKTALFYQSLLLFLAAIGIISALMITVFADETNVLSTRVYAFISAGTFGLITGLNIKQLATGHRSAWRHLNVAYLKYKGLDDYGEKELIEAYAEAEILIGHINVEASKQ